MTGTAIAAVAGLAACGSNSTPAASNSAATGSASSSAAPQAGQSWSGHHGNGVFGTIASENGNTWTITKRDGTTDTVTITSTTTFGSTKHPVTQSQLVVGDAVMVHGQVSGDTITATRISQGHHHSADTQAASPTATPN